MSRKLERHGLRPVVGMAAALVIGCALLASCGKKESGGAGAEDKVLAKVDGKEIHQSDLDFAAAAALAQNPDTPQNVLMSGLMDQLIARRAAVNAADKAGLDKDPKIQQQIEQLREEVLQRAYVLQEAKKSVTDAALRDLYQREVASFVPQPAIHARLIIACTQADIQTARQRISDGEKFEDVANSTPPQTKISQRGGDLGYVTRDAVPKEVGDVAFGLTVNQVSQPFQMNNGCGKPDAVSGVPASPAYAIVKVEDTKQTEAAGFDQVKPRLEEILTEQYAQQKLQDLVKAAKVERMDPWANVAPPEAAPAPSTGTAPPAAPAAPPPATTPSAPPASAPH